MSSPVHACEVFRAAKGDEVAYQGYLEKMRHNMKLPAYSRFPCSCNPPCPVPTNEEFAALDQRYANDMKVAPYWHAYQSELDLIWAEIKKLHQKVDALQRKEADKWIGRCFKAEGGGAVFKVTAIDGHHFVGTGVRRALGHKGEVVTVVTDREIFAWCLSWRPVELSEAEFQAEFEKTKVEAL